MSGGFFDYNQHYINDIADSIEGEFLRDGIYETEDYSAETFYDKRPMKEMDYFNGATIENREFLLTEIKSLIEILRNCAFRVKELDWFLSGDTGVESYVKRLKERNEKI